MTEVKKTSLKELLEEGQALADKGQHKEAIQLYKTAIVMAKKLDSSTLGSLYIRIANSYYKLEDRDKYTYYYEEYLKLFPQGQVSVFSRLAHSYYYLDPDTSIDYHNKALNVEVNRYDSGCKIFAMTKSSFYSQQDIKDEAEYEIEQLKSTSFRSVKQYNHSEKKKNPNKKLNIGYLSSDCHSHTMMNYILPIWENHNKEEFNFFIFSCSDKNDATTEEIKNTGITFLNCSKLEPAQLAKAIYEKEIDILIDLGGYTHMKTYVSLYKPAPIIVSYLGYLNTLGMKEVDYIMVDEFTIPKDKAYLYTEKPLYLTKGYQIFREKKLPNIEKCPFETNGYITFGSFNCTSKFNDTTFYMWAKILESVPNSKLLLYRTKLTKSVVKHIKDRLAKRGISSDRLLFSSKAYSPHFKAYSLADISLDPYPFSGMSIAIETALMGVPTVTLLGEGMQSRGAGRINHVIGHDDFNATYGDEYVEIATKLASDKTLLQNLRTTLRDKVRNSDLRCSDVDFTRDIEEQYKKAWNDFINSP